MIERFKGEKGKTKLVDALTSQIIINGNQKIANKFSDIIELQEYQLSDVLITQDDEDNHMYFVLSGSVEVYVNNKLVAERKAGEHVGEMALIDTKARRCATLKSVEKTVVGKVTELNFIKIANEYPDIWRKISIEFCNRLRNRNGMIRIPNETPHIFIFSSSESLNIAGYIQLGINNHKNGVEIWTNEVFNPTNQIMEDLEKKIDSIDFAIVVLGADDVVISRKKQSYAPRDNVIFELGLSIGAIGRTRTFIVKPRNEDLKIPSDLLGLTLLDYDKPNDQNKIALAIAPVCTQLKEIFNQHGPR